MVRKKSMEIQTFFGKKVSDSTEYDTIRHPASFALQKNAKKTELSIFQISGDSVQNRVFFHIIDILCGMCYNNQNVFTRRGSYATGAFFEAVYF